MSYDTKVVEKGVGVIAFCDGVTAAANVLEEVSVMPVKYIERLERDVRDINSSNTNTVCIDLQCIKAERHFTGGRHRRRRESLCKRQGL